MHLRTFPRTSSYSLAACLLYGMSIVVILRCFFFVAQQYIENIWKKKTYLMSKPYSASICYVVAIMLCREE